MKAIITILVFSCSALYGQGQELFVATEPASNMPSGSIGFRINTEMYSTNPLNQFSYRLDPEIMFGVSKNLMLHANVYASNVYQSDVRVEGAGLYGKYRFLSLDDVHTHFRMAAFGQLSLIANPEELEVANRLYKSDEIDINGSTSGFTGGIIATQLLHKLAISTSISFVNRIDNLQNPKLPGQSDKSFNYSLSSGYLLFPRKYRNFQQTNFNIYWEFLGAVSLDKKTYFLDAAPAVQFIINSISRIDFSYRWQLYGNMQRLSENYFFLRLEYNLLNFFKNR
jgi:hypothetical protein